MNRLGEHKVKSLLKKNIIILGIFTGIVIKIFYGLGNGQVILTDNQLFVEGKPFNIRGICWSPCGIGDSIGSMFSNWHITDLPMIVNMNANTIRTYYPIYDINVLDNIAANNLKVIIGLTTSDTVKEIAYIEKFKNHDAILMWCLGNEFNYHPEWFDNDIRNWYNKLESLASKIQKIDSYHPVTTAHGELPDSVARTMCPSIQLWGINAYRWDNLNYLFEDWEEWSSLPIWISESGADSYFTVTKIPPSGYENEKMQDSACQKIWECVVENLSSCNPGKQCLGITFFEFNDEWWKAGNPNSQDIGDISPPGVAYDNFFNEEYWGFVKIDRKPKMVYHHFKDIWGKYFSNVKRVGELNKTLKSIINYPNPFNETTQIYFTFNKPSYIDLKILNLQGRVVTELLRGFLGTGQHKVIFNAKGLTAGIYFYQLITEESSTIGKVIYIR